PYAVPTGQPSARLHIDYIAEARAPVAQVMVVNPASEAKCNLALSDGTMLTALGGQATPGYTPSMSRDVVIAAGRPITLHAGSRTFETAGYVNVCFARAKFTPEAGGDYRMLLSRTPQQCLVAVNKRAAGGTEVGVSLVNPVAGCRR